MEPGDIPIGLLGVVNMEEGSVMGRKVNMDFSGEAHDHIQDVTMPMDDMECIFCIGDGIEIMAEQYKGQNGTLFLEETGKSNHLGHTFQ